MPSRTLRRAATVALFAAAAPIQANDADLLRQIDAAQAVALVEVAFVPYGNLVLLHTVLHGESAGLSDTESWLGPCLPAKAAVRGLAAGTSGDAAFYRQVIERAGYSSVLFLRRDGETWRPICTGLEPRQWEQHPQHAEWRAAVDAALARR
jgi:hypothetical protein